MTDTAKRSEATLKPCPFCGGEAKVQPTYDIDTGERDGYFAWCSNYECECKPQTRDYITEAEAIEAWNTRAERTCKLWNPPFVRASHGVKIALYECSECGFRIEPVDEWNYCPNCGAKAIA